MEQGKDGAGQGMEQGKGKPCPYILYAA